jgi:hypothetical protein
LIERAEKRWQAELDRHSTAIRKIEAELKRCYRAKPGTKYDRTAKKGRKK